MQSRASSWASSRHEGCAASSLGFVPRIAVQEHASTSARATRGAEAFLEDFYAHWQKNGTTAIEELFENDKATYVKIAASIMPKEVKVDVELRDHLATFLATMHDITPEPAEPLVSPPKPPVKH